MSGSGRFFHNPDDINIEFFQKEKEGPNPEEYVDSPPDTDEEIKERQRPETLKEFLLRQKFGLDIFISNKNKRNAKQLIEENKSFDSRIQEYEVTLATRITVDISHILKKYENELSSMQAIRTDSESKAVTAKREKILDEVIKALQKQLPELSLGITSMKKEAKSNNFEIIKSALEESIIACKKLQSQNKSFKADSGSPDTNLGAGAGANITPSRRY